MGPPERRITAAALGVDASAMEPIRPDGTPEAVARLAGGVAHDLNNALLPLRAYGEIAQRMTARGEDPSAEIGEMLAAADRATALMRELLAFAGEVVHRPELVDLNELVAASTAGAAVSIHPEPVLVLADRALLESVLATLAGIAQGVTELRVSCAAPAARLVVHSAALELDDETRAHLFEPFVVGGLALAGAQGIVTQSGGTTAVESAPGGGTAFVIELPLASGEGRAQPEPLRAMEAASLVVLLVEDDDAVRSSIERMLASDGYTVVTAANGEDAVLLAGEVRADLVLTDVAMRGLNGRETAERILETQPALPVLFMSGYTDDAALRRSVGDRVTPFLQKPFGAEDLTRAIADVLR
jgi:two-component system, cell cycle sensor histidine kinase and response regulator CckA